MAFYSSPGVYVKEIDLSQVVVGESTGYGATVGAFAQGPVNQVIEVANEQELATIFGKPTSDTANAFFPAANFLGYSNSMKVVRAETTSMANACTTPWVTLAPTLSGSSGTNTITSSTAIDTLLVVGDNIRFAVSAVVTEFTVTEITSDTSFKISTNLDAAVSTVAFEKWQKFQIFNEQHYETMLSTDLDNGGKFAAKYPGEYGNSVSISIADQHAFESTLTGALIFTNGSSAVEGVTTTFLSQVTEGGSNLVFDIDGTAYELLASDVVSDTALTLAETVTVPSTVLTGTGSILVGDLAAVIGVGTEFTTELDVGMTVTIGTHTAVVSAIADATHLTLATPATGAITAGAALSTTSVKLTGVVQKWIFADAFDSAPGTSDRAFALNSTSEDEVHVVIFDQDGLVSGTPGLVLERYVNLSKAANALAVDGSTIFYKNVINTKSDYVWFLSHPADGDGTNDFPSSPGADLTEANRVAFGSDISTTKSFYKMNRPALYNLSGGQAAISTVTDGFMLAGYDLLANDEKYDVSLIVTGKSSPTVINYAIGVAETRMDCVVFASPYDTDTGEPIIGDSDMEVQKLIAFRQLLPSSSYAMLDSGFKYQYDRYNDIYRWVPLNGDIAGLCARTDTIADPWFSPGGFNRGQVRNVAKLAVNPNKTARDKLYKVNINSVVNFPNEGPILYGDKTLQAKASAFDRINVRRLFIVLEKAIAKASKYTLFELNDAFTRAQFKAMVEPFLRDVQGRRGLYDFHVECSEKNNTPQVIDTNEFKADIFLQPAKSINFVTLSFVATRTGVNFQELVGKV